MPAGLQTFDAAGNLVVDTTTRVLKSQTQIAFVANTTAVQSFPLPAGVVQAVVSARPDAGSGDARVIASEKVGGELRYRARSANGQSYTLNVVMY